MRRTSFKTSIAAMGFFMLGFGAMFLAEEYDRTIPRINFGMHSGRPFNHGDYLGIGSFTIFLALLVVSLMFLQKDD